MELKCYIGAPASTPEIALENSAVRLDITNRLRKIKVGSYAVDNGSHSKHFSVSALCLEAAQEIDRLREGLQLIECEPINAEYMARNILEGNPAYHSTMTKVGGGETALKPYNAK